MSRPDFVINKAQRTSGGALEMSVLEKVGGKLLSGGFVLLPSDTCYSLGALPINEDTRKNVDAILDRHLGPISLAFGSYPQVEQFMAENAMVALLIKHFTPGPITIVCKAKDAVPEYFLRNTIGSLDRTIGVRIPDSLAERDIAAGTQFPLMTVAVRENEREVRDFQRALELVRLGTEKLGGADWAAIEANAVFRESHSTVIRVSGLDKVSLIREGEIPFAKIEEYINIQGKHLLHAAALSRVILPSPPPFATEQRKDPPNQEGSAGHTDYFWNALPLIIAIIAASPRLTGISGFLPGVSAFLLCALGVYKAPWFKEKSKDQRLVNKGFILTVLSFVFLSFWVESSVTPKQTAEATMTIAAPTTSPTPTPTRIQQTTR